MKVLELAQDSDLWRTWRRAGIGSSDAPVLMGVSKYSTRDELLRKKKGMLAAEKWTAKTTRGKELEPKARELYELLRGIKVRPVCVIHDDYDWLRASLDGLSVDNTRPIEIKCINADDHRLSVEGQVPSQYVPQVQHQLLVTGLPKLDYWSYSESSKFHPKDRVALVEVLPDPEYMNQLFEIEKEFFEELHADNA
jgi:putative phage-type endonuclease